MKFLILLAAAFSCSLAVEIVSLESLDFKDENFGLDQDLVDSFLERYEQALGDDEIVAIIDEYADKVLENVKQFAVSSGLEPISISDVNEKFLTASITLTNGLLSGVSTISRKDSVEVIYQSNGKLLELYFPITFYDLSFSYDYHLIILLIGPSGSITGDVQNLEMNLKVSFDLNAYQAKVETIEVTNAGNVEITFHGEGVLDIVINILSEFVTTILHPQIINLIQSIVSSVINTAVDALNSLLDGLLHPTTSETVTELIKENYLL